MTRRGFTLIELLIAMAITVVVSAGALVGFQSVKRIERALNDTQVQLANLERAFLTLQRDIGQLTARSIQDELGGRRNAIEYSDFAGAAVEFTRAGWFNPAPELTPPRSELQRVAYRLEDEKLLRRSWHQLDRMVEGAHSDRLMLSDIETVSWRFLDQSSEWQSTWPPADFDPTAEGAVFPIPRAIEMTLTLTRLGELTRLFEVP